MKKIKDRLPLILIFLVTSLIQCISSNKEYYPMEVGKQYLYVSDSTECIKTKFEKVISINNKNYILAEKSNYFQPPLLDTSFYRLKSNGIIMEYINFNKIIFSKEIIPDSILEYFDFETKEQQRYNFNLNIGQGYPVFIKTIDIKLDDLKSMAIAYVTLTSKNENIQINNIIYDNCIRFDYNFITASDLDFSEWFVEGIGLIKIEFKNKNKIFISKR